MARIRQRGRVALGAVLGNAWMVGLALPPYVLSRAIDSLAEGEPDVVLGWTAALLLLGGVLAGLSIWRHRTMTRVRMDAALRTVSEVNAHGIRLGDTMARRALTGEVVAIGGGDTWTIGRSLTVTGPGVGAVLAYAVIAVLLLRISASLALVVLAGVPVLALVVGPATGRLRTVGTPYREQQGRVTGGSWTSSRDWTSSTGWAARRSTQTVSAPSRSGRRSPQIVSGATETLS